MVVMENFPQTTIFLLLYKVKSQFLSSVMVICNMGSEVKSFEKSLLCAPFVLPFGHISNQLSALKRELTFSPTNTFHFFIFFICFLPVKRWEESNQKGIGQKKIT